MLGEMLREGKLPIEYNARWHAIRMLSLGGDWGQDMNNCPFCGASWTPTLEDKWWAEVEALGIDGDDFAEILQKVPLPYRTSQWWKTPGDAG